MTPEQFDSTGFCGNMYATHENEKKFIMSVNFPERLFGLLPEKPDGSFTDADMWQVEWVRCENITEIIKPQVLSFNNTQKVSEI